MASTLKYLQPVKQIQKGFGQDYAQVSDELVATAAKNIETQTNLGKEQYNELQVLFKNVASEAAGLPQGAQEYLGNMFKDTQERLDNIVETKGYREGMHNMQLLAKEFSSSVAPFQAAGKGLSETMAIIDESDADFQSKELLRSIASSGITFDPKTNKIQQVSSNKIRDLATGWKNWSDELDGYLKSVREKPLQDEQGNIIGQARTSSDLYSFAQAYVLQDPQLRAQAELEAQHRLQTDSNFATIFQDASGNIPPDALTRNYEVEIDGERTTINPISYHIMSKADPYVQAYTSFDLDTSGGSKGSKGNPEGHVSPIADVAVSIANTRVDDLYMNITDGRFERGVDTYKTGQAIQSYAEFLTRRKEELEQHNVKMAAFENDLITAGIPREAIITSEGGLPSLDTSNPYFENNLGALRNAQNIMSWYRKEFNDKVKLETDTRAFFIRVDGEFEDYKTNQLNNTSLYNLSDPHIYVGRGVGDRLLLEPGSIPRPIISTKGGEVKIDNRDTIREALVQQVDAVASERGFTKDSPIYKEYIEGIDYSLSRVDQSLFEGYARASAVVSERLRENEPLLEVRTYSVPQGLELNGYKVYDTLEEQYKNAESILARVKGTLADGSYIMGPDNEPISDLKELQRLEFKSGGTGSTDFAFGIDPSDNSRIITGSFTGDVQKQYRFVIKDTNENSFPNLFFGSSIGADNILSSIEDSFISRFAAPGLEGELNKEEVVFDSSYLTQPGLSKTGIKEVKIIKQRLSDGGYQWSFRYTPEGETDSLSSPDVYSSMTDVIRGIQSL
jgi:hypothetical protein